MSKLAWLVAIMPIALTPVAAIAQSSLTPSPLQHIATLPCNMLISPDMNNKTTTDLLPFNDFDRTVPVFGVLQKDWTDEALDTLKERVRQCSVGADPQLRIAISNYLRLIDGRRQKQAMYNQRAQREEAEREAFRMRILTRLGAIQQLASADSQLAQLTQLDTQLRTSFPELHEAIDAAKKVARARQGQQTAAAAQANQVAEAEQALAMKREAVAREEQAARQRQQAAEQEQAAQVTQQRELEALQQKTAGNQARLAEIAREQAALDAKLSGQAMQRTSDEQEAQQRAAEARARRAQLDQAQMNAEGVERQRAAAQRAQDQVQQANDARAKMIEMQRERQRESAQRDAAVQAAAVAEQETIKKAVVLAMAQHGDFAEELGLSAGFVDGKVMMVDINMQNVAPVTLRQYVAMMEVAAPQAKISAVAEGRHEGISFKIPGMESRSLIWRLDGDELYLVASGGGERVQELDNFNALNQRRAMLSALTALASEIVKAATPAK